MTILPLRPKSRGVSAVIGTILMVAVTVVLAAILYTMVSGMGAPSTNPPAAQVQAGVWGGNGTVANYTATVLSAQNVAGINPTTLKFIVAQANGFSCYAGVANQTQARCPGYNVTVQYDDSTGQGAVSASDTIRISVSPPTGNPLVMGKLTIQTSDDKNLATVNL